MKPQKASSEEFEKVIDYYRNKSFEQLTSIIPSWAHGTHSGELLDCSIHPCNGEYQFFLINTLKLISNSEMCEINLDLLFTGEILNDGRIAKILYRWDNNLCVDPPTIGLWQNDKTKIAFSDGRHRTKLAKFLGLEQIPVAVYKADIKNLWKILELNKF